eukprot:SAG25_NODE_983_length_4411_cov_10.764378_1_plen_170_part_00
MQHTKNNSGGSSSFQSKLGLSLARPSELLARPSEFGPRQVREERGPAPRRPIATCPCAWASRAAAAREATAPPRRKLTLPLGWVLLRTAAVTRTTSRCGGVLSDRPLCCPAARCPAIASPTECHPLLTAAERGESEGRQRANRAGTQGSHVLACCSFRKSAQLPAALRA